MEVYSVKIFWSISHLSGNSDAERLNENRSNYAVILVMVAVCFNAFLAFVNGNLIVLNGGHVAAVEFSILAMGSFIVFRDGRLGIVVEKSIIFFIAMSTLTLWVMVISGDVYPKIIRDVAIIFVFTSLGSVCETKQVVRAIVSITAIIFAVMLMEWLATDTYVSIFQPSKYYVSTRGIEEFSIDDSGLFRNSLGFEGRFSFGIFSTHRLSSIMLEQVSLANFAMVVALFLMAFWNVVGKKSRWMLIVFIALAIMSNNTRTGAIFIIFLLSFWWVFAKFRSGVSLLITPFFLIFCWILFFDSSYGNYLKSDDLSGRVGFTLYRIADLSLFELIGGAPELAAQAVDCGYIYIISTLSFFGLIGWWLFPAWIIGNVQAGGRRYIHGFTVFIALNLMIGAGIFTIKIAAVMWFILGHIAAKQERLI